MRGRSLFHAAVLLLAALPSLVARESWTVCDGNGSGRRYSAGSTYEDNLLYLLGNLQTNSSSSPKLFDAGSFGADPNAVYGLMLCRGDVSASACSACGTRVLEDVMASCNRSRDVAYYDDECYIHFSDTNFHISANNAGRINFVRVQSINSTNVTGYAGAVTDLLNATVRYAVENSTRLFATGKWTGTDPDFPHIYSVAQCMPDLSPALCRSCLEEILADWWKLFYRNVTCAGMAGPQCNLRSDAQTDAFYTGEAMVRLPIQLAPAPAAPAPKNYAKVIITAVLISAGILLLVLVVWFSMSLFMWKRTGISFVKRAGLGEFRRFEYRHLVEATGNFSPKNKIGEGAFGVVYMGALKTHSSVDQPDEVVVKQIKKSVMGEANDFLGELKASSRTSHKNLVRLKGWCCSRIKWKLSDFVLCRQQHDTDLFLVYELVPNGSLHDHLNHDMTWETRYKIVKGIGSGLCYLHHESKPYILHRDIKPCNILLEADFNPKIADFGLSRIANNNNTMPATTAIGTKGYMDPLLCMKVGKVKYTRASDVYSFGVVLLDIAYPQKTTDQVREMYRQLGPEKFLEDAADDKLGSDFNRMQQMKQVVILGLWCCYPDEAVRPSMEDAMKVLGNDANLLDRGMWVLKYGKLPDEQIIQKEDGCKISSMSSPDLQCQPLIPMYRR